MNTETFRAPDMMAALENIQQKLGPDAMVLLVREIFDESCWKIWKKPGVEVLASTKEANPTRSTSDPIGELPVQTLKTSAGSVVLEPDQGIYNLSRIPAASQEHNALSVYKIVKEKLLQQGILPSILDEIIQACQDVLPPQVQRDIYRIESFIQDSISAELVVMPEIQIGNSGVICLTGSGGSGKTSTIAKLAAKFSQEDSRNVVWISADTFRAGAIAEAQAYTDTLGILYQKAYTADEFGSLVEAFRKDHLVLVDLFDCNPNREDQLVMVKDYLAAVKPIDTYLVLSATIKLTDVSKTLNVYQDYPIQGIIPTKLDETDGLGPVISAVCQSRLPLVYCTAGPSVLDELQQPDPALISRSIVLSPPQNL